MVSCLIIAIIYPCPNKQHLKYKHLSTQIFYNAVFSMTKICVICLFKKNFKAKCRLIQKNLEASEGCFPNREIWGERCKKTAFLKGSTNDGANQASYLLKRAPFLICKAKLSIQSTIDFQINIASWLFWGWLDLNITENFAKASKLSWCFFFHILMITTKTKSTYTMKWKKLPFFLISILFEVKVCKRNDNL